jgi:hypothetical protein
MPRFKLMLSLILLLMTHPLLAQTDYFEQEPNDAFPPAFLAGNPIMLPGDRLIGSISTDDFDLHYLTLRGTGTLGIYRYRFDLTSQNGIGGDPFLMLFDTTEEGYILGFNDDFPGLGLHSRIYFDHFDLTGADTVFGINIGVASPSEAFDYALAWSREPTPVIALGALTGGYRQVVGAIAPGLGDWYSFTLDQARLLSIDTLGSEIRDTELALFDANGNTIGADDDIQLFEGQLHSRITARLEPGTYYLAVGPYNSFYNWNLLLQQPLGWDRDGFSADVVSGGYRLNFHVVPEPGSLYAVLIGLTLLPLTLKRRRS